MIEMLEIIGYAAAVLVGVTMGLIGSGGSILSVPIFTYIMGVEPVLATAYSLFTVGSTALFGGVQKARQKQVDFKKVVLFGIPTLTSVFLTRKFIVPALPDVIFSTDYFELTKPVLIMLVFAVVMIFSALKMIKPNKESQETSEPKSILFIISIAVAIGLVAGFVGAGGGFLIIPALLFFTDTPMKTAVGTSLGIIAIQSLIGFTGDIMNNQPIQWSMLLIFTAFSFAGIVLGNYMAKRIKGEKLKTGFGWFVLLMALYILTNELVLKN